MVKQQTQPYVMVELNQSQMRSQVFLNRAQLSLVSCWLDGASFAINNWSVHVFNIANSATRDCQLLSICMRADLSPSADYAWFCYTVRVFA